jgi:hypothetical protein
MNLVKYFKSNNMSQYSLAIAFAAAFLLLIPLVAMLISGEVNWSPGDFIIAWILLAGTGFIYKVLSIKAANNAYRTGVAVTVGTALFLVWSNLAVGLIGSEDNPANIMFFVVLAILFMGILVSRFNPHGMSLALFITAGAQLLAGIIALITRMGYPENPPMLILGVTAFFVVLWAGAGLLFRYAAFETVGKINTPGKEK